MGLKPPTRFCWYSRTSKWGHQLLNFSFSFGTNFLLGFRMWKIQVSWQCCDKLPTQVLVVKPKKKPPKMPWIFEQLPSFPCLFAAKKVTTLPETNSINHLKTGWLWSFRFGARRANFQGRTAAVSFREGIYTMRIPSRSNQDFMECQPRVSKVAHLFLLRSCHQRICPLGCGDLVFLSSHPSIKKVVVDLRAALNVSNREQVDKRG